MSVGRSRDLYEAFLGHWDSLPALRLTIVMRGRSTFRFSLFLSCSRMPQQQALGASKILSLFFPLLLQERARRRR